MSFESARFLKDADFSRSNFWCQLQFWNAELKFKMRQSVYYQYDNEENKQHSVSFMLKKLRESARIVKNALISEGNKIHSLNYFVSENRLYLAEIRMFNRQVRKKAFKKFAFKKLKLKDFLKELLHLKLAEWIVLISNKWSNHFGQSWLLGIGFTVVFALIFHLIYLIPFYNYLEFSCESPNVRIFVMDLIQLINLTDWEYCPYGLENNYRYAILFVSRIFIGYGYYQTIQAFRKFGKT